MAACLFQYPDDLLSYLSTYFKHIPGIKQDHLNGCHGIRVSQGLVHALCQYQPAGDQPFFGTLTKT
jgi:hypothetical protein